MACEKQRLYKDAIFYLEMALEMSPENAEVLEKALANMRFKTAPPPPVAVPVAQPVAPAPVQQSKPVEPPVEEVRVIAEVKPEPPKMVGEEKPKALDPVELANIFKFEPQPIFQEAPNAITTERHASAGFATELAIAELCVKQGLLKAAIDVYQQLLDEDPSLLEVRNRLNDVNAVYLRKWMDSSVLDSTEQSSPFLPFVL
jgi:tetratricopeptide (TPR) repeat protein